MTTHLRFIGATVLLAIIAVGFGCATRLPYSSEMHVSETTEGETREISYAFEIADGAQTAAMTLRVLGHGGTAVWTLLDPHQTVRWQGRAQGNVAIDDARHYNALPGEWTLKWSVENFSGEYEFGLQAKKD